MTTNSTAQTSTDSSIPTFTSSVVFNVALTGGLFIAFEITRKRNKKVYEPRTYLVPEEKRSESSHGGLLGWLIPILKISDDKVVNRIGLDAYMFLRFIRLFAIIYAVFTIVGIGILLPVNYINQLGKPGLNSFTMGNISDSNRLYAHVIAAYFFSGKGKGNLLAIHYLRIETLTYIRLRHEYLTTPEHRISPRATTILVLGIPNKLNNENELKRLFDVFPGGVRRIWINRDPDNISKLHTKREGLIGKLEASETALIRTYAIHLEKKVDGGEEDIEAGSKVPKALRPVHRTSPVIGSKVDSIETYRRELRTINGKIDERLKNIKDFRQLNSAFIQFNNYVGAQMAANLTIPHLTEISPGDVIWENLNIPRSQKMVRRLFSFSVSTALTLLWLIPVAFVASISKLSKLTEVIPFLQPVVDKLPSSVIGIIQGSALELFQIGPLVVNILFKKFLVKTPRQAWDLERTLTMMDWGTSFPPHILMAAIGIWVMGLNFKHNPSVDFLPANLMGVINMKNLEVITETGKTSVQEHEVEKIQDNADEVHITHTQEEEDQGATTYLNPAFVAKQPVVWLPQDPEGVSDEEVNACREDGINATNQGATLNEKKGIDVDVNN
ncbi:9876_t:CDS:2, partial [Acaulospora colombiana]